MRICIPTETPAAQTAKVYSHFGSAPYFTIYDTDKGAFQVIDNPNQDHIHSTCQPMIALDGKDIDIVVCAGMGARALLKLNKEGIKVYRAATDTVEEILAQYEHSSFEEITAENACSQHNCH